MIVVRAFRLQQLKLAVGLSLTLGIFCLRRSRTSARKALRTGAARYEASKWSVSAADEAFLFTPSGFTKPGKTVTATGQDIGHLTIKVCDKSTGKPTFCRMNVVGPDGNYYQPKENKLASYSLTASAWTDRIERMPRANRPGVPPVRYYGRFFYCSGEITVDVPAGPVRVEVWKGFEYQPAVLETRVSARDSQTAELTIERTLPMSAERYYSGDPHLHFPRQTPADDELVLDMMEADDIHFGSILAYNDPPGPYAGVMGELVAPQSRGLGKKSICRRGDYHILSGQEYRSTTYGHLNLYMQDGMVLPNQQTNADDWPLYGDLGKALQEIGGYAFYAHGGYAQSIYADFVQGGINGVELLQFSVYRGIGLDDWYHMLNCGYRFPALGASDYPWCRLLGDNKTFVHIDGDPDFAKWLRGAAEGRSFVTSGPMLLLEISDEAGKSAAPGDQISVKGKGPHRMNVRVRVRSEVAPVTNVQVIVNGELVEEMVTPVEQGTGRWVTLERPLELSESSWIAAPHTRKLQRVRRTPKRIRIQSTFTWTAKRPTGRPR